MGALLRSRWLRPLAVPALALGLLLLALGGWRGTRGAPPEPVGAGLEGFEVVHRAVVTPDSPVQATAQVDRAEGTWRLAARGGWRFAHTGEQLSADVLLAEGLLRLGAGQPELLGRSGAASVFAPADEADGAPLQLRVDTDPLVERYLVAPAEVRAALSGAVTVELLLRPAPVTGLAAAGPPLAIGPILALLAGLALGLRRRIDRIERSEELRLLDRIEARARELAAVTEPGLRARLESAVTAARGLARRCAERRELLAGLESTGAGQGLATALGRGVEALRRIDAALAEVVAESRSRRLDEATADVVEREGRGRRALDALGREAAAVRDARSELERLERATGARQAEVA